MRHRRLKGKLGRNSSHRKAMMRNMVASLIYHERIRTTLPKAKELRKVFAHMVTLAKSETLHARRQALQVVPDRKIVAKLFDTLASRYAKRQGGYTRIYKIGTRRGDAAQMALIELVDAEEK